MIKSNWVGCIASLDGVLGEGLSEVMIKDIPLV